MTSKVRLVCATRATRDAFPATTALGRCLAFYNYAQVELRLFERNTAGLSACYNEAIAESTGDPAILVFVHDDVLLCDHFWIDRIIDASRAFDIAGLAGNKRRLPRQPAWHLADTLEQWDARENLSGIIGQGTGFPPQHLNVYGPPYQEVKLLDGVLLIASSAVLIERGLRFDERFDFHLYDLDFCREAEARGMVMGTWPLSVVHQSPGHGLGGEGWQRNCARYLEKWGD